MKTKSNLADVYIHAANGICAAGSNLTEISDFVSNAGKHSFTETDQFTQGQALPVGLVNQQLPSLEVLENKYQSRTNQLLLASLEPLNDILAELRQNIPNHRIAIVLGTSTSGISEGENDIGQHAITEQWPERFDYERQTMANPAEALADMLDINGPCFVISTACSSGAKALASAKRLLQTDMCDLAIAGGVDSLCKLTVRGFSALEAVSDKPCIPFSENRTGINIGEASALFLLSRNESKVKLSGVGESSDAHHFSAPHPEGNGAKASMKTALAEAQIKGCDIGYINLHGTATEQNDRMESKAVAELCGKDVLCSSTKSYFGHTLGAAGAIEAALIWQCLAVPDASLPVHLWDNSPDPELETINLVTKNTKNKPISSAISNSFAFGGNNISLLMERCC